MFLQSLLSIFLSLFGFFAFAEQIGDFVYSSNSSLETPIINSLWYDVYLFQTELIDHLITSSITLIQEDALDIVDSINTLSSYGLISAMRNSSDKVQILDEYISSLKYTFYRANSIQRQLKSEMSLLSSQISSCSREKKLYDKQYLNALKESFSVQNLESLVSLSQNSASCISNKQILLTSKKSLSDLIANKLSPLSDKYIYLIENKEAIIEHFSLLDANYLQKVIDIQETMKKY